MSQTRCGSGVTARLRHWVGLLAYIFKILSKFEVVFIKYSHGPFHSSTGHHVHHKLVPYPKSKSTMHHKLAPYGNTILGSIWVTINMV